MKYTCVSGLVLSFSPLASGPIPTLNPCNDLETKGNFEMRENQRTINLVKLMLHRPLQTGKQTLPQAEAEDEKSRDVKRFLRPAFSAGVFVDELIWKAPISWGSISSAPTVQVFIHKNKVLHIGPQRYFIIMLSTPLKHKTRAKWKQTLFFYKNKATTSEQQEFPP